MGTPAAFPGVTSKRGPWGMWKWEKTKLSGDKAGQAQVSKRKFGHRHVLSLASHPEG